MKYFLYGYYGYNNFGDDLLLKILIEQIENRDKNAFFYIKNFEEIEFLESKSNIFLTNIEKIITAKKNKFFKFWLYILSCFKYIKKSDTLVIGPGGLFLDKGKLNISLFLMYLMVRYASFLNKKIIIIGISFDLIANHINIYLIKKIFKKAHFISVRDFISYSYVKYLNVSDFATRSLDLVFLLNNTKSKFINNKTIGLCFIDYYNEYEKNATIREKFCEKIYNEISKINGYKLVYIIFQSSKGLNDDFIYNFLVNRGIEIEKKLITVDNFYELEKIDNFITMRYHLGVLGVLFDKKVLVIDHEIKMTSLKLDFNVDYISIDDFFIKKNIFYDFLESSYRKSLDNQNVFKEIAKENFKWLN